ncbi:hypothetical protein D5F01_LYC25330 [Larimichthys crocea]|uniref:Uncharacterized protein n=1 Tax=Larimichthys crocea TaxID=215358 RepID=A0A6G0HCM2_LARCR|nr:hypothetical protein D5F01_LYC25330 [Larimichthys crocea]
MTEKLCVRLMASKRRRVGDFVLTFLSLPVSAVVFDVASVNTERILHRGSGGVTSIVWSLEPLKRTAVVLVGFQTSLNIGLPQTCPVIFVVCCVQVRSHLDTRNLAWLCVPSSLVETKLNRSKHTKPFKHTPFDSTHYATFDSTHDVRLYARDVRLYARTFDSHARDVRLYADDVRLYARDVRLYADDVRLYARDVRLYAATFDSTHATFDSTQTTFTLRSDVRLYMSN